MPVDLFISGLLLSLSLCLDLGTVNVAMIRTGVRDGALPAFALGLGSSIGDLTYALISLFALSFVMNHIAVRWALWLGGTAMLLYLAYHMLREALDQPATTDLDNGPAVKRGAGGHFLLGIGLALSSPSAILWFAMVGGSVIASTVAGQAGLLPFFSGFFVAGLLWSLAVSMVTAQGGRIMNARTLRWFSIASAGLFLYLAVKVFVDGYRTLV